MNDVRPFIRMTFALGLMVLVAMAFSVPALSDIARGESDLDLEWAVVRVTALLMLMFIGSSFSIIRAIMRTDPRA